MSKVELMRLLEEAVSNLNILNSAVEDINKNKQEIQVSREEINGEGGVVSQIKEKEQEINEAYNVICEDDEAGESIRTQLENILENFENDQKRINEVTENVFGYEKANEDGSVEKVRGLFGEIDGFHTEQKEKYTRLYKKIEEELESGTASVNLSKSFADKVKEYHQGGVVSSVFFVGLLGISVFFGYDTIIQESKNVTSIQDVWRLLALRAPLIAFVIWLAIFFGNRRAESKKLEESYKHKEVMARAFIGYKKTIEELGEGDERNQLLQEHMRNLLKAIGTDSSKFLNSEGEKHPIMEVLNFFPRLGSKSRENIATDNPLKVDGDDILK